MRLLSTRRQRKQNPQRARNPGGRSVHVRTPVRHDSIGGIRSVNGMPGVIGIVLIAITKRLVGARVSTRGMRLSFSSPDSPDRKVASLSTSLPTLSSAIGDLTKLDPIRPSQLVARSLPRRGAEMKMTRPISGRCSKMSASVRSFLLSGERDVCSGGFLKKSIQSLSSASVMSSRLMQPPMLWPITTIGLRSGKRFSIASSSWRRIAAE